MEQELKLNNLPDGFTADKVINCRESGLSERMPTLRLSKCDYKPIERNNFSGWFAFPDTIAQGSKFPRHSLIARIIHDGGACRVAYIVRGKIVAKENVRILEAFQDRGNVVIHIEKN